MTSEAMPVLKLTRTCIRDATSDDGVIPAGEYRDSELKGFLLLVGAPKLKDPQEGDKGGLVTGRCTWNFDYWNAAGAHRRVVLGHMPGLSADGARTLALGVAAEVASGVDVFATRKAEKEAATKAKSSTLGAFMSRHYEEWARSHLKSGAFAVSRIKADFAGWYSRPMTQITPFLAENWRKAQLRDGKKPRTVNRDLQRLQSALTKAKELGIIDGNPLAGIKPLRFDKTGRVRYLTADESTALRDALVKREEKLRKANERFNEHLAARNRKPLPFERSRAAQDHLRSMTLLALNTGLRRGEIFQLRWRDVDEKQRILTVAGEGAKSGQTRRIPLNDEALAVLQTWRKQTGEGASDAVVFPGRSGHLTRIDTAWRSLMKLAKVKNFRFHDCRHDFASRLVMAGVPLNTVRELLGHASLEMTMKYAHLAPHHLHSAVANLNPGQVA
jgi:integrase